MFGRIKSDEAARPVLKSVFWGRVARACCRVLGIAGPPLSRPYRSLSGPVASSVDRLDPQLAHRGARLWCASVMFVGMLVWSSHASASSPRGIVALVEIPFALGAFLLGVLFAWLGRKRSLPRWLVNVALGVLSWICLGIAGVAIYDVVASARLHDLLTLNVVAALVDCALVLGVWFLFYRSIRLSLSGWGAYGSKRDRKG